MDVLPDCMPRPPALLKARGKRKKRREVSHLFRMLHTYTHPGRSRVNLKGKRKKKADGQKAKTAQGGGNERTSRTNLRGETDLTKTEHTT